MRGTAAWQLDCGPARGDSPDTLLIVLGGRWRIDQDLPSADTLKACLAKPVAASLSTQASSQTGIPAW